MNKMYERIEVLCKQKGVNISQMCRDAGVSRGNITDLKYNRTTELSTRTLGKLSEYFGVTMDCLLGKDEKKPADELDGLTPVKAEIIKMISSLSDEQARKALRLLQVLGEE